MKSLLDELKEAVALNPWDLLGEDRSEDLKDLQEYEEKKLLANQE